MRRRLLANALLVGLILTLPMAAQAEIVGDFPQVVIFATNSIEIQQNSTVHTGDVVANNATGGATLVPPFELSIGNKSTFPFGWEVKADTINVGNFVNLNGSVLCNPVGSVGFVCTGLSPLPVYGELPIFQSAPAGGTPVNVPKSGSVTLTAGTYGNVTVGLEGTIVFAGGGDFNLGSFTSGRKAQIVVTGPSEIRIAGDMNTGVEDNINLSGPLASQVVFYVNGNASLGDKTTVNANFYVAGLLSLGSNLIGTGAFLGTDVRLGQKVQATLSTFWDFPPVPLDDAETTPEDNAVTIDVLANDSDPDGDPIFVNSVTQGSNGTVACTGGTAFPCAVDETLTYTPNADYFGDDSFTYEVCDDDSQPNKANEDNCTDATVTVTVESVNDPPIAADDSLGPLDEDTSLVFTTADLLANDKAGPPGPPAEDATSTISIQTLSAPANGHFDVPVIPVPTGNITYFPDPNFNGTDTFGYTICDDGDGVDDPTVLCDSGTVTITVTPVNDPPTANDQDLFATATVQITLTGSDPDGDSLAFSVVSGPSKGTLGAITPIVPSGGGPVISATVDYTPDPQECSGDPLVCPEDAFTFRVDDGNGLSDTAVVTINPGGDPPADPPGVSGVDAKDALISEDTAYETETGVPVAITLRAAAPVAPDPNPIGDLAFTIVAGTLSGGTLSPDPPTPGAGNPIRSATTTFTPTCTPGGDPPVCIGSFDFEACDLATGLNCDTATVEIIVSASAPPTPPVAEDVSAATEAASQVVFSLVASAGSPPDEPPGDDGRQTLAALSASATGGIDPLDNGGWQGAGSGLRSAAPTPLAPLSPGTWTQFTWWDEVGAGGPPQATCTGPGNLVQAATNLEGPFTFNLSEEGCLSVTDVLLTGDQFEVLNSGQKIDTTPLVPQGGPNVGDDPGAAFASPAYSHRLIPLPIGSYSISLTTIPGNSLWCGRGYLRVDTVASGNCDAEPPLLVYTVLTVPDSSFGTLLDSTGQTVTAGSVLPDASLTFQAVATSGTNSQTTYTATNTSTGLVSNVATVNLGIVSDVIVNLCQTDEEFCDDGRNGGMAPIQGGSSSSAIDAMIDGPRFTIEVEGKGDVATSRRWYDGRSYLGVTCSGGGACGGDFVAGSNVVLYARPVEHDSEFVGWGGDCRGSDPVTVVTVDRDTVCTALFRSRDD